LAPMEVQEIEVPVSVHPRIGELPFSQLPFCIGGPFKPYTSGYVTLKPNTLTIEDITIDTQNQQATLEVRTIRDQSFQLQGSPLTSPLQWTNLGNPFDGADLPFTINQPIPQGQSEYFYRLVEKPEQP
ncbi:MAG: hypothetical protein AAGC74_01835, partial [Verrucomicrobiota bacterium]